MNTEKLSNFIQKPDLIGKQDLIEIKESISKYPYCSTLHLLFIKGLSNINDINFEEELKKASIHVNSREQMYHIIQKQEVSEEPIITEEPKLENTDQDNKISVKESNSFEVEPEVKKEIPLIKDEEETQLEKKSISIELEKEIFANVIDSSIIFDVENVDHDSEAEINPDKSTEEHLSTPFEIQTKTDEDLSISDNIIAPSKAIEVEVDLSKLSFTEWLVYKQGKKISIKTLDTDKIIEEKEEEKVVEKEQKLTKKEINDLLDKFIEHEPKFSRPKKEFFNPVENAKQSLEESDVLVSETLAKIYFMQKNYSKAIKAYEQLSLLNPKKKSFFANQIKKIKKEENK